MSRFNNYARQIDQIAQTAFGAYQKAEAALKDAEEMARKYPERSSLASPDYQRKAARAKANLIEAQNAMKAAKDGLQGHESKLAALRRALATEIDEAYSADPTKIDENTIRLLESGILRAGEYSRLLKQAQEAGNSTMMRLIGKAAFDKAEAEAKDGGQYTDTVKELRMVYNASKATTGDEYLQKFDYLSEVFSRATNTPALAGVPDRWSKLTQAVIEEF